MWVGVFHPCTVSWEQLIHALISSLLLLLLLLRPSHSSSTVAAQCLYLPLGDQGPPKARNYGICVLLPWLYCSFFLFFGLESPLPLPPSAFFLSISILMLLVDYVAAVNCFYKHGFWSDLTLLVSSLPALLPLPLSTHAAVFFHHRYFFFLLSALHLYPLDPFFIFTHNKSG